MWNPYSDQCKTVCTARQKFKCHSIFSNGNSGVKQYVKIGITKFFTSGLSGKRSVSDLLGAAAHPDRITRTSRQDNQNYGRWGGKVHWICFDLCIRSNKKNPNNKGKQRWHSPLLHVLSCSVFRMWSTRTQGIVCRRVMVLCVPNFQRNQNKVSKQIRTQLLHISTRKASCIFVKKVWKRLLS